MILASSHPHVVAGLAAGVLAGLLVGARVASGAEAPGPGRRHQAAPNAQPAVATPPAATTIDATVIDAKGQPIANLGADAFRVSLDEKPRTVQAVQFIALGPQGAGSPQNAVPGRSIYLAIDRTSVFAGAERPLVEVASAVLDRLLPGDRAALVPLPGSAGRAELTEDTSAVQQALSQVTGSRSPELANFGMGVGEAFGIFENDTFVLTSVADRECRFSRERTLTLGDQPARPDSSNPRAECVRKIAQDVESMTTQARRASAPAYQGLLDLLTSLRDVDGPKAVILVTAGLGLDRGPGAFDEVGIRASAAGASLHALLVEPAQGGQGPRLRPVNPINDRRSLDQRLDDLTAMGRGTSQPVNARSDEVFDRLLQELTGFYRLTIASEAPDAGTARLRVEVPGRGATVRARPALGRAAPATRREATKDERLADALRGGARGASALGVRVAGYVLLRSRREASLLVAGEVDAGADQAQPQAGLAMSYVVFDETRQPVLTGSVAPVTAHGGGGTVPFVGSLDGLAAGRYVLRVAAADAKGRTGTAEQPLDLRVRPLGDLAAGDLVLARLDAAGPEAMPAVGRFATNETVGLQLDIAGEDDRGDLVARFEVHAPGGGPALLTLDGRMTAGGSGSVRRATAVLRAGLLPPGRYDARAELARGATPLGRAERAFEVVASERTAAPREESGASGGAWVQAVWPLVPRFSRQAMLSPDALGAALAQLQRRAASSAARSAIERAAAQPEAIAVDGDLRAADPLAAAFLEGVALFGRADLEAAAGRFREALRLGSDFYPAMVYLGACYAAGGRDREAVGAWQTALVDEHQRDQAAIYRALVEAFLRLRETSAAREMLDEASATWPQDRVLIEQRVMVDLLQGSAAQALTRLDQLPSPSAELLFMALTAIYDAHVSGAPIVEQGEDRRRAVLYADRYRSAGGAQQALVDRWVAAIRP